MKKKRRILFGAVDIGYRIGLYSSFIRRYYPDQLEAESLAIYVVPREHYELSYTYQYQFHQRPAFYRWTVALYNFVRFLFRFDVFHFFSGETILPRKLRRFEFAAYKLFGKRLIMHFVGSDLRNEDYLRWREKHIAEFLAGEDNPDKSSAWQKKLIRDSEKYADHIIVSTPDLARLISGAEVYPVMLDVDKFREEVAAASASLPPGDPEEIVILHCPSNIKLKGTPRIHEVLKKISAETKYRVRLILPAESKPDTGLTYSTSRYDLFRYYSQADIVIDQLLIGWYGLQTVEALALGKVAVCYIEDSLQQHLYPGCPIVQADHNSLEAALLKCIEQVAAGRRPGKEQAEWVKRYHTIEHNHEPLLRAWQVTNKKSN